MGKYRNRNRSDERMPRSLRRGKVRDARVKGKSKRRKMENVLFVDPKLRATSSRVFQFLQSKRPSFLIPFSIFFRQVADKWKNKDGTKECFYGEVVSFNVKTKKYLVKSKTGDENPVP